MKTIGKHDRYDGVKKERNIDLESAYARSARLRRDHRPSKYVKENPRSRRRPEFWRAKADTSIVACLICFSFFLMPAIANAGLLRPGDILETFDPYGDAEVEVMAEGDAIDRLRPKLMFSLGYTYTYRTGFEHKLASSAVEQMHMWTVGANYMPWTFLFVGAALPVAIAKFEGGDDPPATGSVATEVLPEYDWTGGLADLSTYVGSELPWIPLTLTAMLMWPTGDIEKGMGTGEFSGGFMADLSLTFGKVNTKLGGFYFLFQDPAVTTTDQNGDIIPAEPKTLPNSYGASIAATMPVSNMRMGIGFRWSYRTMITWDTGHVLEPSFKIVWPVTDWFATVVNAGFEVYPTFALTPTLALVWSL